MTAGTHGGICEGMNTACDDAEGLDPFTRDSTSPLPHGAPVVSSVSLDTQLGQPHFRNHRSEGRFF